MKGIIVVDIPETCENCKLSEKTWDDTEMLITCPFMPYQVECGNKQNQEEYCPIKQMPLKEEPDPQYAEDEWVNGYDFGWNECIDKILKGNKENEKD